jgi:sensor histidine kinase regulating citrate/malate metabolism
MQFLNNLPIRRKLTVITMLTSGIALLISSLSLVTYEQFTTRKRMVQDLSTTAEMIGRNSASGLAFSESDSVQQSLQSLTAQHSIREVWIYDQNGKPFAGYHRAGLPQDSAAPRVRGDGYEFGRNDLVLFKKINLTGENIGTVRIEMDLSEMTARVGRYVLIMGLVFLVSAGVAYVFSAQLQKLISEPVSDLAGVMTMVAAERNYSVRAVKKGNDELGRLMEGFNEMLAQIQHRDAALEKAGNELQKRVDERTAELASSLSLVNATLESTTDGILVTDAEGKVRNSNAQFLQLFQLPRPVADYPDRSAMQAVILPQLKHPDAALKVVKDIAKAPDAESFDVLEFHDGRVVERYSKPQRIGDKCVGRVWSYREITQRRRAEEELHGKTTILQALLESSHDGILLVDTEGKKAFQNRRMIDLWRIPPNIATDLDDLTQLEWVKNMLRDPALFVEKVRHLYSHPDEISHDEIQLLDGRVFDRSSYPAVGRDGTRYGRIWAFRDISERRKSEAELEVMHRKLLDASRQAGMAEVATGVLHNVGNVLNSVNVSCNVVARNLSQSKAGSLSKVSALLKEHENDLGDFFSNDPKAKHVPEFLAQLSAVLAGEKDGMLRELAGLQKNIEHIKDIVAMQQSFAMVSGVTETIRITDLVEDALNMNNSSLARNGVQVLREFAPELPPVSTDKHKVLQILVNLIRNAKHACEDSGRSDKCVAVGVTNGNGRVKICVKDNGVGIPGENLARIFSHGFTTKKNGHGFGLHSGALAAKELGGTLAVHSDGPGKGAIFTLELPLKS